MKIYLRENEDYWDRLKKVIGGDRKVYPVFTDSSYYFQLVFEEYDLADFSLMVSNHNWSYTIDSTEEGFGNGSGEPESWSTLYAIASQMDMEPVHISTRSFSDELLYQYGPGEVISVHFPENILYLFKDNGWKLE